MSNATKKRATGFEGMRADILNFMRTLTVKGDTEIKDTE